MIPVTSTHVAGKMKRDSVEESFVSLGVRRHRPRGEHDAGPGRHRDRTSPCPGL